MTPASGELRVRARVDEVLVEVEEIEVEEQPAAHPLAETRAQSFVPGYVPVAEAKALQKENRYLQKVLSAWRDLAIGRRRLLLAQQTGLPGPEDQTAARQVVKAQHALEQLGVNPDTGKALSKTKGKK